MKTNQRLRKLVLTAILAALSFATSTLIVFPNMAPFQHMFNMIGAVILGPSYNFISAFITGSMRIAIGRPIGALVGGIIGAWLAGWLYKLFNHYFAAFIGEVIGTGIISAFVVFLIDSIVLNFQIPTFYYYIPFYLPSSLLGASVGWGVLLVLERQGIFKKWKGK